MPKLLPKSSPTRIMVFGTFDGLHPGHDNFFQQARALAKNAPAFLVVSVARDSNVQRIKGNRPWRSDNQRLNAVKKHPLVDRAVLGASGNHLPHIMRQRPDIIALGYDQKAYVQGLRSALTRQGWIGKIFRLKPYLPQKYKSSLLKRKI